MLRRLLVVLWLSVSTMGGCAGENAIAASNCSKLTKGQLASLSDEELENSILECLGEKIGGDYKNAYRIVMSQPRVLQVVYITWWVEAEVNNGGFNQYFWNSSGEFADDAPKAFEDIGAVKHNRLMKRALDVAIKEWPKMKKYHEAGTMEAFSNSYNETALNDLDEEFYKLTEDVSKLRAKYIRMNVGQLAKLAN